MNYKLKSNNGEATFLLKTGKDFVKNQMPAASAQHIIDKGTLKKPIRDDYPINVDDKWFFEGEAVSEQNLDEEEAVDEEEGE